VTLDQRLKGVERKRDRRHRDSSSSSDSSVASSSSSSSSESSGSSSDDHKKRGKSKKKKGELLCDTFDVPSKKTSSTRRDLFLMDLKMEAEKLKVERNRKEADNLLSVVKSLLKGGLDTSGRRAIAFAAARIEELNRVENFSPEYATGFARAIKAKGEDKPLLASSHKSGLLAEAAARSRKQGMSSSSSSKKPAFKKYSSSSSSKKSSSSPSGGAGQK
jgi:hypothetical protein